LPRAARRSPFEGHAGAIHPKSAGPAGVRLQAETLPSVTQISTWISGVHALEQALAVLLGRQPPMLTGSTLPTGHGLLVRTGPEEFLLVAEDAVDNTALLRRHVAGDIGAVTDLSHARCRIRISGDKCRDALSKLFPIDLRNAAFPESQVRLTGHHHVPGLLHRTGRDQFDLYVFTTYAQDQLQVLADAGLEYGVTIAA
jgi:sarcosine oxidase subunit gamma